MTEKATLAGGCFWCTEAIFKRLRGVQNILPGYAGGTEENPTYEAVSRGDTGHVEAVQIEFNPTEIPYEKILDIFWHTHDPTTLNRQGNDVGPQYRSVIFYHDENQRVLAEKSKEEIERAKVYPEPIVTEIIPFTNFFVAENSHQNYYDRNRTQGYCSFVIDPKISKLLKEYSSDVKEEYRH
ncbi:MAG: peptide-methionine (S)-S-oxide reductase MsrA [Candidatus Moraniibacteriota bacterium]